MLVVVIPMETRMLNTSNRCIHPDAPIPGKVYALKMVFNSEEWLALAKLPRHPNINCFYCAFSTFSFLRFVLTAAVTHHDLFALRVRVRAALELPAPCRN